MLCALKTFIRREINAQVNAVELAKLGFVVLYYMVRYCNFISGSSRGQCSITNIYSILCLRESTI